MKFHHKIQKKLTIELFMDSSELIMFNKGGRHDIELPPIIKNMIDNDTKLIITIQLERNQQGRFDHVFGPGQEHRKQCDSINNTTDYKSKFFTPH